MKRALAGLALIFACGTTSGCAHLLPWLPRAVRDCPGEIASTDTIPGRFLLRQRYRLTTKDQDIRIQLAVQKDAERIVVVGLDAFGATVFTLTQKGVDTHVDALPAPALQVSPENVLRDIHRVRFLTAEPPAGGTGSAVAVNGGTRITEYWNEGSLATRHLEPIDGGAQGTVAVEFGPEPRTARIRNDACGSTTLIETLTETLLP